MDSSMKEMHFVVKWKHGEEVPFVGPFYAEPPMMGYPYVHEENTNKCELTIYVQGKLPDGSGLFGIKNELIILSVHDVGTNPLNSFVKFVNSPQITKFQQQFGAIFLHICVPGQEPKVKEFLERFPTMDELSQILPQVLDHFGIKRCIAMGEGAGADVVYRFACTNPEMVSGVMLIHCTSSTHGFVQNLREMIANLRIEEGKMSESAWDYLMAHKLGQKHTAQAKAYFIEGIRQLGLNEHNLSQYLHAFANREVLEISRPSKFHTILISGSKSPHIKNIFHMFEQMDKEMTGLIVAIGVEDILIEAPEYLANAFTNLLKTINLPCAKCAFDAEQSNIDAINSCLSPPDVSNATQSTGCRPKCAENCGQQNKLPIPNLDRSRCDSKGSNFECSH